MAKYNLDKYTSADGLGFPLNFRRGNPNPLDNSSIWASIEAAQNYAATDPVAYVGQILTVVSTTEDGATSAVAYSIQDEAGTLKEIGSVPVGDGLTIEVINGKIQLKGADTAESGAQPRMKADGSIEWIVPSTETVEGLQTTVAGLEALVGDTKVSDQISTAVAAEAEIARAAEKANADAIDAIEADYLKTADKTELAGAIATAKQEAIEAILDGVTDDFDTLKEVAAWIQSDTTASTELVTRVSNIEADYLKGADKTALQGEIGALETFVGELPEGATSDTVVEYIQEVVDGLKIGDYAKAADLTALATRVTAAESAIEVLEGKVGDKTVAEQISDVTDAMSEKITALEGKAHTHENATVLDGITAEKVAAWDKVSEKANDADLAAVAKSGLIDDLSIGESTVLIFDCGDSNV